MFITSPAIVLGTIRHNDTTIITTLYTQEMGAVAFAIRTPRSRKANIHTNLYQPLNQLLVEWDHRPNTQLQRPKNTHTLHPYATLLYHPVKATIATFLAEILYHTLTNEHQGDLYPYLQHSLLWLDTAESNYANFHIVFLLRLTTFLGIQPHLEHAGEEDYFDLQNAEYSPTIPTHPYYIEPKYATHIPLILRLNYQTMHLLPLNREQRAFILQHIVTYYRLHIPSFPKPRSLDILTQIFK